MPHSKAQTTTLTANNAHARREKKENNGADPFQFKKFHAHIAHEGKEIAEKAHDLPVDPVHQLIRDRRGNKVPNKYCSFTSGDAKDRRPDGRQPFA